MDCKEFGLVASSLFFFHLPVQILKIKFLSHCKQGFKFMLVVMLVLVVDKELRALLLLFFEFQWDIENQTSNFLAHLVIYWVLLQKLHGFQIPISPTWQWPCCIWST